MTGVVTETKKPISTSCSTGRASVTEKTMTEASTMPAVPQLVPRVGAWMRS